MTVFRCHAKSLFIAVTLVAAWPVCTLARDAGAGSSIGSVSKGKRLRPDKGESETVSHGSRKKVQHESGPGGTPKAETSKGASYKARAKEDTEARPNAVKQVDPTNLGPIETNLGPIETTPLLKEPKSVVQPPIKISPPKALTTPTKPLPQTNPVVRNAIGVRVPNERAVPQQTQGSPAATTAAVKGNGSHIRAAAAAPAREQHQIGAVSGSEPPRPGHGTAAIGGSAKPLAQINGSTIRRKY